jgi:hypothetical protein
MKAVYITGFPHFEKNATWMPTQVANRAKTCIIKQVYTK